MKSNSEKGFSVIETLVAIAFSSIVAMGIAKSTLLSKKIGNKTNHDNYAMQLALEALEDIADTDPATLTAASGSTNANLTANGWSFTRVIAIVVNTDRTRTATVNVTSNAPGVNTDVSVEGTFASVSYTHLTLPTICSV